MRTPTLVLLALASSLAACAGPPPSADQRRAAHDDLNQSGHPYKGPPGFMASAPPADSSSTPLRCHFEGPGEVCDRSNP